MCSRRVGRYWDNNQLGRWESHSISSADIHEDVLGMHLAASGQQPQLKPLHESTPAFPAREKLPGAILPLDTGIMPITALLLVMILLLCAAVAT
jgi:hypothetical protein